MAPASSARDDVARGIEPVDPLLTLIPDKRPGAFDALTVPDRGLRGRIFLAMWPDGYSESVAWAVALARDVLGVVGEWGFLDIFDDVKLRAAVEARGAAGRGAIDPSGEFTAHDHRETDEVNGR